jgi:hypothetical protein
LDADEEGEAEKNEYGSDDELSKSLGSEQLEDYMEDLEEMQDVNHNLRIPADVKDEDVDYGMEDMDAEEGEEEQEEGPSDEEDMENDVFAMAREN